MELTKFTAIGRPLNWSYLTNRLIVILTFIVLVVTAVIEISAGSGILLVVVRSLAAALSVFFAWAIGRELDPDEDYSAILAAVLMTVYVFTSGFPNLMIPFWLLPAVRILNRTTGHPSRFTDSFVVFVLGAWLTFAYGWIFLAATFLIFLLDSVVTPGHSYNWLFAILSVSVCILSFFVIDYTFAAELTGTYYIIFTAVVSIAFLVTAIVENKIDVTCDLTSEPVNAARVRLARIVTLVTILVYSILDGEGAVRSAAIPWVVMAAIPLFKVKYVFVRE